MRLRLPRLPLRLWMAVSHLMVLALPVLALLVTGSMARELQLQAQAELTHQGAAIARLAEPLLVRGDRAAMADLEAALGAVEADTGSRVELLDATGRVLMGSPPRDRPLTLSDRREVAQALTGQRAFAVRKRPKGCAAAECRGLVRVFMATPIWHDEAVIGAVRVSLAPRHALQAVGGWPFWLAVGLTLACTVVLAVAWGHVLSRSLTALSRTSRRIQDGEFHAVHALERPGRSHVTEVGALARGVSAMALRLEQRLAYIGEFASNVSHEFKTPITTLRGTVELLRDDDQMDAEQRARFLENALADLDRMERLVSGLLALARAEQAGPREPVDLDALLAQLAERFGIPVEGEAGAVPGNPAQIAAAIGNLVENALQHGGPDVRVRLLAWREERGAFIEIIDDGQGISAANLPKVFDRFFTTGRARGRAGLGLALVRAVCEAHGGEVSVQSRPGETRFRVRLPW
ncbi:MAG: ATP-binding protein [Pseudomonadota bacterium]